MMKLDNFIGMMTGHFDNKEQFNMMQATGKIYPYAKHVNTVCNDKINNIPHDFNGKFVVEESYYETNGNRHAALRGFLWSSSHGCWRTALPGWAHSTTGCRRFKSGSRGL